MRTTSHTRVGGRTEVSDGGRVKVRRALGRARVRRAPAGPTAARASLRRAVAMRDLASGKQLFCTLRNQPVYIKESGQEDAFT